MKAESNLTEALRVVVDKIDAAVRAGNYEGLPIDMILAGGLAMHHYSRSRYTHDIDASFSRRIILPVKELTTQVSSAQTASRRFCISTIITIRNFWPHASGLRAGLERVAGHWQ